MNAGSFEILMVEDDPGDANLAIEIFKELNPEVKVKVVEDGQKALAYLYKAGKDSSHKIPDLIILDLNMPRKDGRETLEEIKTDDKLKSIPVVIFTTSDAQQDIENSYLLGCNSYIAKPVGLEEFTQAIKEINKYWFATVRLPHRS